MAASVASVASVASAEEEGRAVGAHEGAASRSAPSKNTPPFDYWTAIKLTALVATALTAGAATIVALRGAAVYQGWGDWKEYDADTGEGHEYFDKSSNFLGGNDIAVAAALACATLTMMIILICKGLAYKHSEKSSETQSLTTSLHRITADEAKYTFYAYKAYNALACIGILLAMYGIGAGISTAIGYSFSDVSDIGVQSSAPNSPSHASSANLAAYYGLYVGLMAAAVALFFRNPLSKAVDKGLAKLSTLSMPTFSWPKLGAGQQTGSPSFKYNQAGNAAQAARAAEAAGGGHAGTFATRPTAGGSESGASAAGRATSDFRREAGAALSKP
jgi:hypothetical protein